MRWEQGRTQDFGKGGLRGMNQLRGGGFSPVSPPLRTPMDGSKQEVANSQCAMRND